VVSVLVQGSRPIGIVRGQFGDSPITPMAFVIGTIAQVQTAKAAEPTSHRVALVPLAMSRKK
jgi:hypothetical protein